MKTKAAWRASRRKPLDRGATRKQKRAPSFFRRAKYNAQSDAVQHRKNDSNGGDLRASERIAGCTKGI